MVDALDYSQNRRQRKPFSRFARSKAHGFREDFAVKSAGLLAASEARSSKEDKLAQ
jgi:hypothetical protein